MERICVAIRVKPPSRQEACVGAQWKVVENTVLLHSASGSPVKGQTYSFDTIFGTGVNNADIYNEHAKELVQSAVSGFNGTVFAYGQTSSGKTYTMQGSATDPGVTRLAIRDVFTNIEKIEDREFLIRVSYMEIYNEEINDLLTPDNRKLQIHESIERGIFVAGLREEIVDSVEQVVAVLERGEAQRHFGETNMNVNSSRSHTIFRVVIESRDKSHDAKQVKDPSVQDAVRVSALNLVDLAGSERISKTGAGGVRLKEGAHINKSLTTLGIVINKLSEGGGKQGAHIPYRDSKLTRILQSALGGNAKTAIICTINPDEIHIDETRGTLQFASRAKRVTNCAQVNEILTDAALLKRQKREIEDLRRRLQGSPHSEDLEKEILHLRNDLLKFELERERLELELQEEKKAQVERERRIKEQEQRIENLSTLVITGGMEDREISNKKVNRRGTWCPRLSRSDILDQGFRRITPEKGDFSVAASFDTSVRSLTLRRGRTFGLPPTFESLISDESDSFWSTISGVDGSPGLADFQNIADEDTWASLNRGTPELANVADENTWANLNEGHTNNSSRLSYALSDVENRMGSRQVHSSLVTDDLCKIIVLEKQLNDMELQYQDLQLSMELKIEEGTKQAVAAVNKTLLQEKSTSKLQEVKDLRSKVKNLESELENCKCENNQLKAESLNLHDQLLHAKAALEQGVQERVSMDEENKIFRQRLRSLEMGIQDDYHQQSDTTCYLEDDLVHNMFDSNESSDLCVLCQSSMDKNFQETSMSYSVPNSEGAAGIPPEETPVHKVNKRRLFDDNTAYRIYEAENCAESGRRHEHDIAGDNDEIIAAVSRLCGRIKQLADPGAKMMEPGSIESRASHEEKNLKVSLKLAKGLASQLLEELKRIVNHDIRCLESHVASKGTVGKYIEALQVLLLDNANLALYLFYNLSSKEPLLTPKNLQQLIRDIAYDGVGYPVVDIVSKKNQGPMEPDQLLQKWETPTTKQVANFTPFEIHMKIDLQKSLEECSGQLRAPGSIQLLSSEKPEVSMAGCASVEHPGSWNKPVSEASLLTSEDTEEDICNFDLQPGYDQEPGMASNIQTSFDCEGQMTIIPKSSEKSLDSIQKVEIDGNLGEELIMMQNMSAAEKQFTKELLSKVKDLEARLTVAEMVVVEYKVEIEHLKVNNLRVSMEASLESDDWELQNLRAECEIQKEEIRQLMEQVMTPDAELERESLFRETVERNNFLEQCLKKAERRLLKAKGWREELLQLREADIRRKKAYYDMQARNAMLEKEGILLHRALLNPQLSVLSKDDGSTKHLDEAKKSEVLNEAQRMDLQLLLAVGAMKEAASAPSSTKLCTTPRPSSNQTGQPSGPQSRPPRTALREVKNNSLNVLQRSLPANLKGSPFHQTDIKKLYLSDIFDKENEQCLIGVSTATH